MNKQILVLYSRDTYPDGSRPYEHHVEKLNESAQSEGLSTEFSYGVLAELLFVYRDSQLQVIEPRSGRDIASFDIVFFQKWKFETQVGLAAAIYLDSKQVEYRSRELRQQNPFDKLAEMALLVTEGLPYAQTISTALSVLKSEGSEVVERYRMSFPVLIKPVAGTRGEGIELFRSSEELDQYLREANSDDVTRMLLQEYIPNDYDYRVTVMGGKIAYVLRRQAQDGSHVNNTSAGGTAIFVEENEWNVAPIQDGLKAALATGREDFAGVDVLVGRDGSHIILEVNKSPEIQTGYGVDRKMQKLVHYLAGE